MTLMIQQRPGQRAGIGNPAGKERAVDESVCERVWDSLEGEGPEIGRKSQIQAQAVHSASRGLIRDAQGRRRNARVRLETPVPGATKSRSLTRLSRLYYVSEGGQGASSERHSRSDQRKPGNLDPSGAEVGEETPGMNCER